MTTTDNLTVAPATHTVTWNKDGGAFETEPPTTVDYGDDIADPGTITKNGYTFDGWYTESTFANKASFPIENVAANITLYAKWTAIDPGNDPDPDPDPEPDPNPGDSNTDIIVSGDISDASANLGDMFTEEDNAIIANGGDVEIKLVVEQITASAAPEDAAMLEAEAGDKTIALYLDLKLLKTVTGAGAANITDQEIQPPSGEKLTVTFTLPEELRDKENYYIIRAHNGAASTIDADYDAASHTLTFETDRFSTYAVAYTEKSAAPPPSDIGVSAPFGGNGLGGNNISSSDGNNSNNNSAHSNITSNISDGGSNAAVQTLRKGDGFYDTVFGKSIEVRLYADWPVLGRTTGSQVNGVRGFFEKWFINQIRVIHFDRPGLWEQPVHVAAKIDFTGMDTGDLHLYGYDRRINEYNLLANQKYQIDGKGFLHFITEYAGDIIISDGTFMELGDIISEGTRFYAARPSVTKITQLNNSAVPLTGIPDITPAEKTGRDSLLTPALLILSLLALSMLWVVLPRKNDQYVTVEEYRNKIRR